MFKIEIERLGKSSSSVYLKKNVGYRKWLSNGRERLTNMDHCRDYPVEGRWREGYSLSASFFDLADAMRALLAFQVSFLPLSRYVYYSSILIILLARRPSPRQTSRPLQMLTYICLCIVCYVLCPCQSCHNQFHLFPVHLFTTSIVVNAEKVCGKSSNKSLGGSSEIHGRGCFA
ncbi:hypothetical protein EDD85DRAFT_857060 [Armillaria nabsnona]|nr:hypothetical protein EDD85DRAFT_857060 [Armillaria nabsnona]